jgi:hypothetical protein
VKKNGDVISNNLEFLAGFSYNKDYLRIRMKKIVHRKFTKIFILLTILNSILFSQDRFFMNSKSEGRNITNNNIIESQSLEMKIIPDTGRIQKQKSIYKDSADINLLLKDTANMYRSSEYMPKWHSLLTNLPNDMVRYYNQYINKKYLGQIVSIAVLTTALVMTDDITWKASDKIYKRSQGNKNISDYFTEFGDGRTQFELAGAFALYGFIGNNNRALRTASQIVEGVLASGGVVQVLKHITGRESPYVSSQAGGLWRFFPNQITYHKKVPHYDAFPSGHICTSVAAFTIIAENYPEHKWITPLSCVLTGLIGFGMANSGIHWYSDYPLGIALGYSFGKIIANPEINISESSDKDDKLSVSPYYNFESAGLKLSYNF